MNQRRAIIDIGSNTVRLVVYGGPPRAPVVHYNEKVTAKLGKGVAENGKISARAKNAALAALARYAALLRLQDIDSVETVATAAVRDAADGDAFLDAVRTAGLSPRLLSGEEEALASAQGVVAAFPGERGVVGDLGGGSLELTQIDGGHCAHGASLPLGTLRLAQMRAAGPAEFAQLVVRELRTAQWSGGHAAPFYLVGGAWRALSRYTQHQANWPLDDPHGFEMTPATALGLSDTVGQGQVSNDIPGLSNSRLAALPGAAALLGVLVREFRPAKLVFSAWGLREGLLFRQLGKEAQAQDPLLAGIAAFAEPHGCDIATAAMVAGWTAMANPLDSHGSEPLRLAAILLSLSASRLEPNLRAEQVVEWALRKRWIGVDARGRAMLAAAGLANTGRVQLPAALRQLAPEAVLVEGVAWGLAVRLCRRLSACSAPALANSALTRRDGELVLTVREPWHALCSDTVKKDLGLLARWLGIEPKIQLVEANAPIS